MMENRKQVNFYRLALAEGKRFRMELSDDYRLTGTGGGVFTWLAPVYDSMDQNETWHRLVLSGIFRECKYEIMAAASNKDLREFLYAEERTADQIEEMLREQDLYQKSKHGRSASSQLDRTVPLYPDPGIRRTCGQSFSD